MLLNSIFHYSLAVPPLVPLLLGLFAHCVAPSVQTWIAYGNTFQTEGTLVAPAKSKYLVSKGNVYRRSLQTVKQIGSFYFSILCLTKYQGL